MATNYTKFTSDLQKLVKLARSAIEKQQPVCMTLPKDWSRPRNFPLPIKAHKDTRQREYRPEAVLEWVEFVLNEHQQTTQQVTE